MATYIKEDLSTEKIFDVLNYIGNSIQDEHLPNESLKKVIKLLPNYIDELIVKTEESNQYWEFCKSSTYVYNYDERLNVFKNEFHDVNEKDFIESEIALLKNEHLVLNLTNGNSIDLQKHLHPKKYQDLIYIQNKKIDFLNTLLLNLDDQGNLMHYIRYFKNITCYKLFLDYYNSYKDSNVCLVHTSFIFHQMRNDKYIYSDIEQSDFIKFLDEVEINVGLTKLKSFSDSVKVEKLKHYKDLIRLYEKSLPKE
ncbi:hypothetical protein [Carboxylicivirga sp. RSCT41]|uniref:hypothetical protein n=1 Tax=Carboxylicivirga agarovorans TaxID=3417570 RepID=UPI003D33111E